MDHLVVDLGRVGGAAVLVGALIVGLINAFSGDEAGRGERFRNGATLGAVLGFVVAAGGLAALS